MAKPDFTQIWATTGSKTAVSNANWQQGWEYIGTGYPPRGVFNQWQNTADNRAKYLHDLIEAVTTAASLPLDDDSNRLRDAIMLLSLPAGSLIEYAGLTAPQGFLVANGDLVSRAVYARLFAAIGTVHGAGDGSTTFKLPDARGYHLRGADLGRGIVSGFGVGSVLADEVKSHNHRYKLGPYTSNAPWGDNATSYGNFGGGTPDDQCVLADTSSTGGVENRVKALGTLICIKY